MVAATPAEIQRAERFKTAQAKNLRGIDPLRSAPPSSAKFQSETSDDQAPESPFAKEPGIISPTAPPAGAAFESTAQGATAGLLRGAWSSLPFAIINPFLGVVSLAYINIHFILAYLGGPISQFFSKFGTEWLEQLGAVKATGAGGTALKETAAGKLLGAVLELGEIFVLLVLDSLAVLVALLVIALVGALIQTVGAPLEVVPGLAT
jgi:hypothetical protein